MADVETRPFSRDYSGLVNQTVIGLVIAVLAISSQEYPSPPTPRGWPLSWVKQVVFFPQDKMNELRGVDATLYVRWLRGCFWFVILHTCTTFPILFPIHVEFSDDSISRASMTRASITSLVATHRGLSLLWIHICLLFWITLSWMATLIWICHGAFLLRAQKLAIAAKRMAEYDPSDGTYYPHPHPQYPFTDVPTPDRHHPNFGLRLRTIMVSNVPPSLRNEKVLKEYFEYYLSRKLDVPSMGLTSATQPGFINKSIAFLFNKAKHLPELAPAIPLSPTSRDGKDDAATGSVDNPGPIPHIDRVVVARKMTELAILLERRENFARLLETAHIRLAQKTVLAVKDAMARKEANKPIVRALSKRRKAAMADVERGTVEGEGKKKVVDMTPEERMNQLIEVIGPYVDEFGLNRKAPRRPAFLSRSQFRKLRTEGSQDSDSDGGHPNPTPPQLPTIWEALHSLPNASLEPFHPLISLSHVFRGKIVPTIDYYSAKYSLLTALITENRARAVTDYDAASTAFVTFADPADARRACKYLAVHPLNPLSCLVTMAPAYQDLDWVRVMKSSFDGEFVKDWVVNMGVWAFTVFWLFPVSLLVGLVSIQNISAFLPALSAYLARHAWEEDLIQSFVPTLLVSLLAFSIPPILLLIAKKAHTITTLSALHDLIMTRYYKFLVVNVLVFFCVGTAALQSILDSFKVNQTSRVDILQIVSQSFPTAGPFYVGWMIFTTGMHGGFELALLGLPLILYPKLRGQVTPRKRAIGTRPRTFNFYYWLPMHLLVLHVLLLFAVLNPFVIPFGAFYYFIEAGIVKNQLLHVYAKNYENNGKVLLIRMARYSLDGLVLSQVVFMIYMVVLKKSVNVGLAAFLVVFTTFVKIVITRVLRAQFEHDDILEAQLMVPRTTDPELGQEPSSGEESNDNMPSPMFSWRVPAWVNLSYATVRPHRQAQHRPNPFGPREQTFSRLGSRDFESNVKQDSSSPEAQRLIDGQALPSKPRGHKPAGAWDENLGLVAPHPAAPPWDDDNTVDLPYDNPFYTRDIATDLWLPRDPFAKLNLDDTVDLRRSVTVDPAAGRLGFWAETTASPAAMSEISSVSTPAEERPSAESFEQTVDGSEEIDLPLIIAQRALANDDVEHTVRARRGSTFRRKVSSSTTASRPRRPSIAPRLSNRSFSDSGGRRQRSTSIMSTLQPPVMDRNRSDGDFNNVRPDMHAQAEFVRAHSPHSRLSVAAPSTRQQRSANISAHDAILHEVLAEEEQALADRLEEEQAEVDRATMPRSWFTAWMFRREPPAEEPRQ
ncbi:hypothetical protein FB45DRAFT_897169 [Roridomyces roridus]|uniref:DUF221-domain-containing protein n=1 Tax=Roridomyces roridus TaxID=1738132 RepID=A0AAD7CDB7_9AGAR|nr:hypothetical protein FB45DRAFT_897169 [Roridomyces roridus]